MLRKLVKSLMSTFTWNVSLASWDRSVQFFKAHYLQTFSQAIRRTKFLWLIELWGCALPWLTFVHLLYLLIKECSTLVEVLLSFGTSFVIFNVWFQKISIPSPRMSFRFEPSHPLWNFQFCFILSLKILASETPLPPQNLQWAPFGWVRIFFGTTQ